MKVLLITAKMAESLVQRYAKESNTEFDILVLPVPVAALLNSAYIARMLKARRIVGYDSILVPGMVFGDVSIIERTIGVPTFKGPRYAADLPFVLKSLDEVRLSRTIPACEVLKDRIVRNAVENLRKPEVDRERLLSQPGNMLIGSLPVGKDFPIRIMAEIDDVPRKSDEEIAQTTQYFLRSGADIIDLGMQAKESHPEDVQRAISVVRGITQVPISVDTLDLAEAEVGIRSGAEILLSIDASNYKDVSRFASSATVVIIPTDHKRGIFPKKAEARVRMLEENIGKAKESGLRNLAGDLILDPVNNPGLTESLVSYHHFRARNEYLPLLMGVANVTELIDADSIGVNAILAGIASELGVSILLVTEVSDKAKGSVFEMANASKMMYIARQRDTVPKDLGIDLLKIKEKKFLEEPYQKTFEDNQGIVPASQKKGITLDPKGCIKIMINRLDQEIIAVHYAYGKQEPEVLIKGNTASGIAKTLIDLNLVSRPDHAAYLGSELEKAEIALNIGRSYVQDHPLFD